MTPKKPDTSIWSTSLDRRQLLKGLGVAGSVMALGGPGRLADLLAAETPPSGTSTGDIPRRALGKTGVQVSIQLIDMISVDLCNVFDLKNDLTTTVIIVNL